MISWLACLFLAVPLICSAGERFGDEKYLQQQYWHPKEATLMFKYDTQGSFQGFEVFFKTGKVDLFKKWTVGFNPFPFVLEATLVLSEEGAIIPLARDQSDRVTLWNFNGTNQCISQPQAYLDSRMLDNSDKFGIGIVNPHHLEANQGYKFFIKLKKGDKDPKSLKATLRFRLNMDVWKCHEYDYDPSEDGFSLGSEWWAAYSLLAPVYENPTMGSIAHWFSFAIESFAREGGGTYTFSSDFIPNVSMGQTEHHKLFEN